MAKERVLLEFEAQPAGTMQGETMAMSEAATRSADEAGRQARGFLDVVAGLGVELADHAVPVPMMIGPQGGLAPASLRGMASRGLHGPEALAVGRQSVVIAAEIPEESLEALRDRPDVLVWPDSRLELLEFDCAFEPAATIEAIRESLGVAEIWQRGHEGEGIVVGIIDEGISGADYPVTGGFARPDAGLLPGMASVQSHGSMCAADILVAAPKATLYDYPFLGVPRSGGALQMFQAILNQRAIDGTPHLTNNSYGFVGIPDINLFPNHEVHDPNHPVHRKVREVVAAGVACFFAAGNCGEDCPSGNCDASGIGPGRSIHASNALVEVITVAAVNNGRKRLGYSAQGPGRFEAEKPDIASYSHFFGNFGPGRPAGGTGFDSGTSAATPVAAGVAALLMSAIPNLTPGEIKSALIASAQAIDAAGWSRDTGHGVISASAAFAHLSAALVS